MCTSVLNFLPIPRRLSIWKFHHYYYAARWNVATDQTRCILLVVHGASPTAIRSYLSKLQRSFHHLRGKDTSRWKTHRRDSYFAWTPPLCAQRRYRTTMHKLILNNKMQIECFIPWLVSSGPCRVPWSLVYLPLPATCTHRTTRNTEPRENENRVKGKNPVVIKKWFKISAEGRKSPAYSFYSANLDYVVRTRNGAI